MQNVLNHISDRSPHLTCKLRKKNSNFQRSVRGGYYTAVSCDVIYDAVVLFAKVEVILFDTFIWDQSFRLALLHVLHIN